MSVSGAPTKFPQLWLPATGCTRQENSRHIRCRFPARSTWRCSASAPPNPLLPTWRCSVTPSSPTSWGSEVVFQLETPAALLLFDRTPRRLWPALAYALARQTAQLITSAPPSASWILHLCHGDLGHEPLAQPDDLVPVVQYLNALHRRLSKLDIPMPQAHIPMCTGTTGPSTNPRFYRALSHLRTGIEVIAGLVDELHPEDSHTALRLVEDELGYRVSAVAAACGLGRRTPRAAVDNALLARDLACANTGHPAV